MLQSLSPRRVFFGLALTALVAMLFARVYLAGKSLACALSAVHDPADFSCSVVGRHCPARRPAQPPGRPAGACTPRCAQWPQRRAPPWLSGMYGCNTYLDQVPACGPSLAHMLETLPFHETLSLVLMGDGNCAETQWTALGLSIPSKPWSWPPACVSLPMAGSSQIVPATHHPGHPDSTGPNPTA